MKKTAKTWLAVWFLFSVFARSLGDDYHLSQALHGAQWAHPLGFDTYGRDLLKIVLQASLLSFLFSAAAVVAASASSLLLGNMIALSSRSVQFWALRSLEAFLAFPSLLFALAWAALRGPGWGTLLFALLIGSIPGFIRLIYVRSKELLQEEYVTAARSFGAENRRILFKHLIPAQLSLCRVKAPGLFAGALMAEATLSFMGVGAPIGADTWGALLSQGKTYLVEAPHIALGSGLPLVLVILAFQILSDDFSKKTTP